MKYFNKPLAFLFLLLWAACGGNKSENGEVEVIEIAERTPTVIALSEFTTGMEAIKLETSDSCLLGAISQLRISDKFLYIKDIHFDGIYKFDRNGEFIGRLHQKGQGPGEYIEISDFIIDEAQNTLEIFDLQKKKLLIYNLSDFSFIKDISVPLTIAWEVAKKGDIYYFNTKAFRNTVDGQPTSSEIIAYNPVTGLLVPLFDKIRPDEKRRSWDFNNGFAFNSQNDIFFSVAWQNQCFKIEDTSIRPVFSVDAGAHAVPNGIKNGTYDQKVEYMNSSSSNDKFLFIKLLMYEGNNFMVSCGKGHSPLHFYHYIRFGGQDYFTDKIVNDFIPFQPDAVVNRMAAEKGYLIYLLIPDENQPPQIKQQLEYFNVAMEDNPVILLFKFKE
ncbi:MAG: 6-bladed beta-propeller [Tannerella sp.]|jgi:hypothetical protein|nr:6-bladed beta-propeller [Tannerella sp.]